MNPDDPRTCPCIAAEHPVPPCDDNCYHFGGKIRGKGFCEHCGSAGHSETNVLEPPKEPEIVLAYNTVGRSRIGPFLWRKRGDLFECLEAPHKGTCANPERIEIVRDVSVDELAPGTL